MNPGLQFFFVFVFLIVPSIPVKLHFLFAFVQSVPY